MTNKALVINHTQLAQPSDEGGSANGMTTQQLAEVKRDEHADQIAFAFAEGARVGKQQLAAVVAKITSVSEILSLQEIKKSKKFKGLRVPVGGKLLTLRTWEDYCTHCLGRSRAQVDEDLMNLERFGVEMLEGLSRMGMSVRNMRQMRGLPPADLAAVAAAVKTGDLEHVKKAAEDVIERVRAEREEAERMHAEEVAQHKRKLQAMDLRARQQADRLRAAEEAILQRDMTHLPTDEAAVLGNLRKLTVMAEGALGGLVDAVAQAVEANVSEATVLHARQCLEYIAQRMVDGAQRAGCEFDLASQLAPLPVDQFLAELQATTQTKPQPLSS